MMEKKLRLILDGGSYKASYSIGGKQQKITLGNDKSLSLLAARNMINEMEELMEANYSALILKRMYQINEDAKRCGRSGNIIKYQNKSLDLAMRIMYPEEYDKWLEGCQQPIIGNAIIESKSIEPLEILNVGCTAAGKTRFILGVILNDAEMKNFAPSLTSIKETTACVITYHINSRRNMVNEENNFCVQVELKTENELYESIKMLIVEAAEEYIETIKNKSKEIQEVESIREFAIKAVAKRLEMNYDKTFGLGQQRLNKEMANKIEILMMTGMLDYYGDSKSISKLAETDEDYIVKQLIRDFNENSFEISSDEIFSILNQYEANDSPFGKLVEEISSELMNNLKKFKEEFGENALVGECFTLQGISENSSTLDLISHIFGNKSKQRLGEYYTIEPILKSAEFYFDVERLDIGREIILSDSVGINQGQKDSGRLKEIVTNRVQEAIQKRKPEIILYHTRILTNDDYMLDIIKNLNMQGYGKRTYVVAGRLDTVLSDRVASEGLEVSDVNEAYFSDFVQEIHHTYIENDSVTLNTIIENNYLVCDKTNQLGKKVPGAQQYHCKSVFDKILQTYNETREDILKYNDEEFVGVLEERYICSNVYKNYLSHIPNMIPLDYNRMRWNTLQKAIEKLYSNEFGFDILYPAISLKNIIAEEFNKEENTLALENIFGQDTDAIKRRYLMEVADAAQIVLVTEYRTFMIRLLKMRYDSEYRTDLSTSMTNDRKYNLQRLYKNCLEQEGLHGEYSLLIVFHIAWIRTQEFFELQKKDGGKIAEV